MPTEVKEIIVDSMQKLLKINDLQRAKIVNEFFD